MGSPFTLTENQKVFEMWREATGLDEDSPEWGEVWSVLEQAGLLRADQVPQPALFDDPQLAEVDAAEGRRLRLALLTGASVAAKIERNIAVATAMVVALQDHELADSGLELVHEVLLAEAKFMQITGVVCDSPGDGLQWLLGHQHVTGWVLAYWQGGSGTRTPARDAACELLIALIEESTRNDSFAAQVFDHLDGDGGFRLLPLAHGQWLAYRVDKD